MYNMHHTDKTISHYFLGTLILIVVTFVLFGLRYYLHECALTAEDSNDYAENLAQSMSTHQCLLYALWAFLIFQFFYFFRFLGVTKKAEPNIKKMKWVICVSTSILMLSVSIALFLNWNWPS